MTAHLLEARGVVRLFGTRRAAIAAVDGVSLVVSRGETVAVVGESGSGKSTLGRMLIGLLEPTAGEIRFRGEPLTTLNRATMRRHASMVFQDPLEALDPRMTVGRSIAEPLAIQRLGDADTRRARVADLLAAVGLDPELADRRPAALSGGQRQRVCLARSIALDPEIVILDEPVSGLDVSVQAQVLNLIADLRDELGLAQVLISHDLAVVRLIADRVLVMYGGRIVESGPAASVFDDPQHPYTMALLSSALDLDEERERIVLRGDPPDPGNWPSGCRFRTRCFRAQEICAHLDPALGEDAHTAACHLPGRRAPDSQV